VIPIRPSLRLLARLLLVLPVLPQLACSANRPDEGTTPETGADAQTNLEVRNLGFPDMTIYVVTATGNRVRVGVVNGNSTQLLTLPVYLVRGGDRLRFLADPIGGGRTPVSEELFVTPGETVTLTIPPQ
jgi:hypothetical protein